MGKLYIWGWWQGNNLGDNWIKKTLATIFPEAIFIDTGVQEFEEDSFVVCGGGGLFIYDVISPWDRLENNIAYGMIGLGAEFPHISQKAVSVKERARFFYVRDQYSLDCMNIKGIEQSYDITFAKPLDVVPVETVNFNKLFLVWRDGHELIRNEQFNNYIQPGSSYEEWKYVINNNFTDIVEDDFQTGDDNIEERISDCGFIISGRYHGIVAAIQKGIPFLAIDICPKIRALLHEVGLEEYCIKISEIDKAQELILKAKNNLEEIRKIENAYCVKANDILKKQIRKAKLEILKVLSPLRLIHYGSYWMKENDVVNTMSDDLAKECILKKIDLKAYEKGTDIRIKKCTQTPNGKLCLLEHQKIMEDIKEFGADGIILNSGGLYLEEQTCEFTKDKGIVSVGISLSDPDVYPYNGKLYAEKFDLFYTNSKYSLEHQYDRQKVNINIMPFAASLVHHFYMPEVEKKYDVVIVAHARDDRKKIVEKLSTICNVGTYGSGRENSLGLVNGKEHVRAINTGKLYVSFAKTVAGYNNVKVGLFEAMACNQVVITSYMEELEDYFEIGKEILCYKEEDELYELIKYYLVHDEEREQIREAGYHRFLKDHTYEKRWNVVLENIYMQKGYL